MGLFEIEILCMNNDLFAPPLHSRTIFKLRQNLQNDRPSPLFRLSFPLSYHTLICSLIYTPYEYTLLVCIVVCIVHTERGIIHMRQ